MQTQSDKASLYEVFRDVAAEFSGRSFLRAPATPSASARGLSYADAGLEVRGLMAWYAAEGVGEGDRVAAAYDSRLEVYLHLLALNGLGASIVPLNTAGSDAELDYVLGHSDSVLVVAAEEHEGRLAALATARGLPLRTAGAADAPAPAPVAGEAAREAAMLYTSGTTGRPKGCMLSNEYFLTLGLWYNGLGGRCALSADDRLLTPLPPNHMNALCCSFTAMLMCGGTVIQLDRFHPSTWWQTLRDERATIIHYLGVMPAILLRLPESADDDVGAQVRFGFGAGSDPRHQEVFERRFGFPLLEAWAMTETGAGAVTIADREPRHVGRRCIGRPSAGTEYRIVDEADRDVAAGEPGELLVRARGADPRRGFFSGYYKDPEATREAWRGGWFHTGDVVREGEDGSLFFVDRRKNIIRRSGENIAAVEVEAVLLRHPEVSNCAVTAVPDELRGEEVFAFVVPADGSDEAAGQRLVEHCLGDLAYFKAPGYVAFVDELPLTASQKVSRGTVKADARGRVANGDCLDFRSAKKRPQARAG